MGKKKMVMRRIAALLIVSLMLTSSAFTSLAATRAGDEKISYGELQAENETVDLAANEESVTLEVKAVDLTSTKSVTNKATSAEALEKAEITWKTDADSVELLEDGWRCEVTRKGNLSADEVVKVIAKAVGYDSSVTFTVNVKAATNSEDPKPEEGKYTIELDKGRLYLLVGESFKIDAVLNKDGEPVPNSRIEWSVGNKEFLDLDGDIITGKELGVTDIAATATVDGKVVTPEVSSFKVEVIPKTIINKESLTLIEGNTATITLEGPEGHTVWTEEDGHFGLLDGEEGIVNVTKDAEDKTGKTIKIEALKPGKVIYRVWGQLADAQGKVSQWSKNEFAVEVKPLVVKIEPPADLQEVVDQFEAPEQAAESITQQTEEIRDKVNEAAKEAEVTTDTEAIFNAIEEIPEGSEVKLISVNAEVEIEKDADGKPVVGEDGNPVVVVKQLVFNIAVVTDDGDELPHGVMGNNETEISIKVPLPAQGIKDTWNSATVKHFAKEGDKNPLDEYPTPITRENGKKYITIKAKSFSPFEVSGFSEEVVKDDDNTSSSSSGSGGGGGSRRHVVGGGSSTNSYSMTGNWVMGANGWTFVKSDGQLAANTWGWINGQYYYFDANGNMMTGWQFINGKWYCLNPAEGSLQGAMLTGVILDPLYNAYFYADASGAMVTGWYQVGANWYYFSPVNDGVHVTGALLSGTYVDGYYLGADGAWVPGN